MKKMNTDMRSRGSFSFADNSIHVIRINSIIRMKIRSAGQGTAVIYFVDRRTRRHVNIPAGYQIRQIGGPILTPHWRRFYINWMNSYELLHNGVQVLALIQQMQHSIESDIT